MAQERSARRRAAVAATRLTGWLYLAAGAALLAAVALIPAQDELARARAIQEKAETQIERRRAMLADCGDRLAALAEPNDTLLASLALTHLNLAPAGARWIDLDAQAAPPHRVATVSERRPAPQPERSTLARIATERPWRSVLIVLGAVCVLVGLLPPATPTESSHSA